MHPTISCQLILKNSRRRAADRGWTTYSASASVISPSERIAGPSELRPA